MSTTSVSRFHAALNLTKGRVLMLLATARVIYGAMLAEAATFPSPVPGLVTLLAQITALEAAQQVLASGLRGTAAGTRNTARDALWGSLMSLKAYVQMVADASVENGFTIIKSSGFDVFTLPARNKPVLDARLTSTSGLVKLMANVRVLTGGSKQRPTFNWQYSVDGGQTWVSVPSTPVATTLVGGLPVMRNCSFRVSVTMKLAVQPWSQVVTIPVH